MYSCLIFDIDGTLTNTNKIILDSFNHVTRKYLGYEYSFKELSKFFGPPEDSLLKQMFNEQYEQARRDYYQYYDGNFCCSSGLYPGMLEIIKEAHNRDVKLAIFTGKGHDSTRITLEKTGILKYFDQILTGDDVRHFKPSGEGLRIILEKLNLHPEEALMIGDTSGDVQASRSAGIDVASALWDSYDTEKLKENPGNFNFYSVQELSEFLAANS